MCLVLNDRCLVHQSLRLNLKLASLTAGIFFTLFLLYWTMQEISTQAIFLIEGLAKSSSASDRRQVLSLATVAFDHYDVPAHDSTVKAGGVPVLALWLEKIFHLRADPYDVDATCRVLLFLLRCSESQAVVALSRSGTDLVLVLFQILLDPVYRACITADDTAVPSENPFLLLLERIGNIPWRLEETKRSDQLLRSLQSFIRDTDFPHFVRYQAIRLLANLTAFSVENKLFVPRRPSLLDDIVKAAVANEQLSFDAADKRDWDNMMSAFFLNLGWCACNVSIMLATRGFLDLMIAILRKGQDSSTLKVLECFAMLAREAPAILYYKVFLSLASTQVYVKLLYELCAHGRTKEPHHFYCSAEES
ncbi:predicted protein [Phaeodactylum tricornutum CCAP 1055/1]|uniref:Uncharacterized protein n=1 Tax=Phaeodactylum tricornutum (strain CCAP 1055/1) TaxID=556484 RepID=B7FR03_PHATC|nr:predicted protein [Phaeodactylum tricornutum CCAP 1055/1]EEC51959.1 predicted protein [Phaeodactylum tricornutum CCAP 1055/1]|eukprot:XP_002177496.1 predicted protein [Phaeodactylum tricornutum CCAP 1055/1]